MYQKEEGEVCLMEIRTTIVCCYNQKSIFNEMIRSLNEQSEKVEIIGINNSDGRFSSCSAAFNSVMDQIHTKYVIFSHQDIIYNTDDSLSHIIDYFEKIDSYDIVGVVGRSSLTKERIGNIKQGRDKRRAVSGKVEGIEKCDTVDECFFGGYTECFKRYPFSEKLCNGWHMYAVERCLAALERGNKVYVVDADLTHLSGGKTDHAYNVTFYRISKRYKATVKYLATTCEGAPTTMVLRELCYIKRELHVLKRDFLQARGIR